jgi:predicted PhzF superfamily epimerase YddE/YHI9
LTARRGDAGGIVLDFPAEPAAPAAPPSELVSALGSPRVVAAGRNRFDWLLQVESAAVVRALQPDMAVLAGIDMRGVMVTAESDDSRHDFVSRWFGPGVGVPEDPVTGSAHCCLGPWWAERLGRTALMGYQASPRGGSVGVRMCEERVELMGRAVTVLRGRLLG